MRKYDLEPEPMQQEFVDFFAERIPKLMIGGLLIMDRRGLAYRRDGDRILAPPPPIVPPDPNIQSVRFTAEGGIAGGGN